MQHSAFQRDGESTDALGYSKKHPRMRSDMRAHKQLSTGHITGLMLCFHQTDNTFFWEECSPSDRIVHLLLAEVSHPSSLPGQSRQMAAAGQTTANF